MPLGHLSSLKKCLFRSSAHFLMGCLFTCLLLSCMSCLFILEIKPLSIVSFANIFSHSEGCLFILFMVFFAVQKLLSLIRSHFFIFFFYFHYSKRWVKKDLDVIYVNKCSAYIFPQEVSSLPKCFTVSDLTMRSLTHFEFMFVNGVRKCSNFILSH